MKKIDDLIINKLTTVCLKRVDCEEYQRCPKCLHVIKFKQSLLKILVKELPKRKGDRRKYSSHQLIERVGWNAYLLATLKKLEELLN